MFLEKYLRLNWSPFIETQNQELQRLFHLIAQRFLLCTYQHPHYDPSNNCQQHVNCEHRPNSKHRLQYHRSYFLRWFLLNHNYHTRRFNPGDKTEARHIFIWACVSHDWKCERCWLVKTCQKFRVGIFLRCFPQTILVKAHHSARTPDTAQWRHTLDHFRQDPAGCAISFSHDVRWENLKCACHRWWTITRL